MIQKLGEVIFVPFKTIALKVVDFLPLLMGAIILLVVGEKDAAQRVLAVLKETFGNRYEKGYLSRSVDVKEMRDGIAQTFHNIPESGKELE